MYFVHTYYILHNTYLNTYNYLSTQQVQSKWTIFNAEISPSNGNFFLYYDPLIRMALNSKSGDNQ